MRCAMRAYLIQPLDSSGDGADDYGIIEGPRVVPSVRNFAAQGVAFRVIKPLNGLAKSAGFLELSNCELLLCDGKQICINYESSLV